MNVNARSHIITHGISRFVVCLFLCSFMNIFTSYAQHKWKVEAEDLAVGSPLSFVAWSEGGLDKWGGKWVVESHPEASGGKVLRGISEPRLEESRGAEVVFNKAGVWNIWARYEQQEHPLSGMLLVIRDADEQVIGSGLIGYDVFSALPDMARKV